MPDGTQTIDYAALAKQSGAINSQPASQPNSVDYAALAKQAGAMNSQPADPSLWGRIKTEFGRSDLAQQGRASYDAKRGNVGVPGSFEGHPENIGEYVPASAGEIAGGTKDIARGNVARGAHRIIGGAGAALLPAAPFVAAAAPSLFVRGVTGGLLGSKAFEAGSEALGANPDQSALAGDIGGLAGGAFSTSGAASRLASRALLLGRSPEGAYQSALKPPTTLSPMERSRVLETGLREKIPVGKGGLDKISDLLDGLNSEISSTIATNPDVPINKFAVASRLGRAAKSAALQVNPEADLNSIAEAGNEFLRNQPGDIPATTAQDLKQGTYRSLGKKAYGELKGSSIEAQKALARGLKEEIANNFPELKDLNAREGGLIDLQDELERAVGRISNHQLVGIGTPIAAGGIKAVTGSSKLAAAAGVIKGILDSPGVKSRLAYSLYQAGVPQNSIPSRISGYVGALAQRAIAPSLQDQTDDQ